MVSSLFKIETLYTPIWQKENQSTRHINRGIRINPELHQQGNNKTESCAYLSMSLARTISFLKDPFWNYSLLSNRISSTIFLHSLKLEKRLMFFAIK